MEYLDCVIPAHEKDFEVLGAVVSSIRRCCPEVRRIIVLSRERWEGTPEAPVEWLDESADLWPFGLDDMRDCGCRPGWLLQQLLKLYAPLCVPDISQDVLVCDADVIWAPAAAPVRFLEIDGAGRPKARICTFGSDGCPPIRSAVDLHRYDDFVPAVLPGLEKPIRGNETAVCHHMCFQRDIVLGLVQRVEAAHSGAAFWAAFRDAARACEGRASEYELYHAFARRHFPQQVVPRQLAFAVVGNIEEALASPSAGVAFFVAHSHLRRLSKHELMDREGIINGDVEAETLRRLMCGKPKDLHALIVGSGML